MRPARHDDVPAAEASCDVAVVGAGVNGAAVALALATAGYAVTLVDRGDIGGGTSQASTMLIWGGLLYLKDFEFGTVLALCRERDRLIAGEPDLVRVCEMRHVATRDARPARLVAAALRGYWLLGGRRRARPRRLRAWDEQALLADAGAQAFAFEEGALRDSDARFVLALARRAAAAGASIRTYTAVEAIETGTTARPWRLQTRHRLDGHHTALDARFVVNAAGGWADGVNGLAGLVTPWRHVLSRGVSIALPRHPRHASHLVFDTADGNTLTLAPWGPVAVWASTESLHPTMDEAGRIAPDDVRYLLHHYAARFAVPAVVDDVVSMRVGVRPVAVAREQPVDARGLGLSRHHRLHLQPDRPWLTIYGGKLSGCRGLASEARALVRSRLAPGDARQRDSATATRPAEVGPVPGLDTPAVTPAWSAAHEYCRTLDDYLRRRTNVAQWVPRGGFGRRDEYASAIAAMAEALHPGDAAGARRDLAAYRARVDEADALLRAVVPVRLPSLSGVSR